MSRADITYANGGAARAVAGAVDVSEPVAGFYQGKLRSGGVLVGIRLWYGPPHDPVTGEEMDRSWRWQAEANGQPVDFNAVWPACAASPIAAEQYEFYAKRQRWAEKNAPDSSFADPRKRHDPLNSLLPF